MKDQRQELRRDTDRQREERQERGGVRPAQTRLTARQLEGLLRSGDGLLELTAPLLEQLARAVGNSSLAQLMGQGSGPSPVYVLPPLTPLEGEEPVNAIRTSPPALAPFAGWPEGGGWDTRPARPGNIRDRCS